MAAYCASGIWERIKFLGRVEMADGRPSLLKGYSSFALSACDGSFDLVGKWNSNLTLRGGFRACLSYTEHLSTFCRFESNRGRFGRRVSEEKRERHAEIRGYAQRLSGLVRGGGWVKQGAKLAAPPQAC